MEIVVDRMDKKLIYGVGIGIIIIFLVLTVPKYFNGSVTASGTHISGDIATIEVYHFHATRQCYTCKTLGEFSEETVKTYFQDELDSGKIVYNHINIDEPENEILTKKFGATGSSLIIGINGKDGSFSKQADTNVFYKISDKEEFMNYLKGVIENKLSGV